MNKPKIGPFFGQNYEIQLCGKRLSETKLILIHFWSKLRDKNV